jgi:hypothetical protein
MFNLHHNLGCIPALRMQTTFLNVLAGYQTSQAAAEGEISVNGERVDGSKMRRISGFVHQVQGCAMFAASSHLVWLSKAVCCIDPHNSSSAKRIHAPHLLIQAIVAPYVLLLCECFALGVA